MNAPHRQLDQQVLEVAARVFDCSVDEAATLTRASEPTWDSLRHVELLFTIEDEFDVRFDQEELGTLSSIESLIESIGRHRGSA
jgi:acyl carrier protein